ncbi:MAG TPA: CRISPR locus-related DNA-binding protein [Euryarchaeota archaeon]|nr:CRISPR locus-related DNA-binding protein [Euryarchaeota archaeon]
MSKTLISTLGFEESFCYRAILRHEIREGDRIILVTASMTKKVSDAYDWIKRFIDSSYKGKVSVELIQLDPSNFEESVKTMSLKLREIGEQKVIVNLSGGMRALIISVLFSLMISPMKDFEVELELEDSSGLVIVPLPLLKLSELKSKLSRERIRVLIELRNGARDVNTISKRIRKDKTTVRRHLKTLKELGLVNYRGGKPLLFYLTKLGEVLVELLREDKTNHKIYK